MLKLCLSMKETSPAVLPFTTDSRKDRPRKHRGFSVTSFGECLRFRSGTSCDRDWYETCLLNTILAGALLSAELGETSVVSSHEDDISCSDFSKEMIGNQLIPCKALLEAVMKKARCNTCGFPLTVMEDLFFRRGLYTKMAPHCITRSCECENAVFQVPTHTQSKALNSRSVLAARAVGREGAGPHTHSQRH